MESSLPGNGASTVSKATASAHSAIDEAARKAKPVIERAAVIAHEATDKVGSAGSRTVDWLSEQGDQLAATHQQVMDGTSEYVSSNPLKALGIALAVGFLISRLVR